MIKDFRVKTLRESQKPYAQSAPGLKRKLSPIRPTKMNVYMDCLNELTLQKFEHCKSRIQFPQVEERVKRNTLLCVLFVQNVTVYNNYDLPNMKIPPKFSWEAIYEGRSLQLTTPYSYGKTCQGVVDFMFKSNAKHPLLLKLWKVKNYEEQYIGEIELTVADFVDFEVILEYQGKMVKETFVQKEMFKVFNGLSASIGQVSLKIIQFCSSSIPTNKLSNIPGSPKTAEQRKKYNQIEESKSKGFEWGSSRDEDYLIQMIGEALQEVLPQIVVTLEDVLKLIESYDGRMNIIMEIRMECSMNEKRLKINTLKRIKMEQLLIMSSQLMQTDDGLIQATQGLKQLSTKGRIRRQDLEAALQALQCEVTRLLCYAKDEMGMCVMDFMFESDSLPEIVLYFNQLNFTDETTLEGFAKGLFDNIRERLRKNHYLKALAVFIKALSNFPNIGLVVQMYSYAEDNILISDTVQAPFCCDFNLNDYQHVIVLSKIRKLCSKFLKPNNPFMQSLEKTYVLAKRDTYFKVPVMPKNVATKQEYLILNDLDYNLFNEFVRRKRWGNFVKQVDQTELVYQQDLYGVSPMMNFLENAPLDVILQLPAINNQTANDGKTSLHCLLLNPDQSLTNQLACIDKFQLLNDKLWNGFSPLALLLERMVHRQRKHKSRIIKELKQALDSHKQIQIIERLSMNIPDMIKNFNIEKYLLYAQNIPSHEFKESCQKQKGKPFEILYLIDPKVMEWDTFYSHHTVPALMLCKLDESIQELLWPQFQWVNWIVPMWNYPIDDHKGQTLLNAIAHTNQSQVIYQQINKEQQIEYINPSDSFYQETEKFNLSTIFQNLLLEEGLPQKLKDEIQKRFRFPKETIKEDTNKSKQMMTLLQQQKYQPVYEFLLEQLDEQDKSMKFTFKYNQLAVELMAATRLNMVKMFRKAYDSKFDELLNFVNMLVKAVSCNNTQYIHLSLYFAQLRLNTLTRSIIIKQNPYLQCLNTHWALELDDSQFKAMLEDIKDASTQNEINYIVYLLAVHGRHVKLKLLLEKRQMTNQNYLVQALPIAAHQAQTIRNQNYYIQLKQLLSESDIKRLYMEDCQEFLKPAKLPKVEPRKPFDKSKPVQCKWVALQGVLQMQLQQIYKQCSHHNFRVKSEQQIITKQYSQFWAMEYQYKLKRMFPKQNVKALFYTATIKSTDFPRVIDILLDKIVSLKLAPSDEFFNYVHVHDKIQDLLIQSSNQNISIVQALKCMIHVFTQEQSPEILQRCINFIKKHLNSKIYKDLNEYFQQGCKEQLLLKKYLLKSDPSLSSCKFATEVVLILDQNFTTQEFEQMELMNSPNDNSASDIATLLTKQRNNDKRITAFIQKYVGSIANRKQYQITFTPTNLDYLVGISKQGVSCLLDNGFEQLIKRGAYSYLKQYFFSALKPKSILTEEQKIVFIQLAVSSGNQETLQLCIDDLCNAKNNELKSIILKGNILARAMAVGSQDVLLYLTRKIIKQFTFSSKEILKLVCISDEGAEVVDTNLITLPMNSKGSKQLQQLPFMGIFQKDCQTFYKEFFMDFLNKIAPQEHKNIMSKILNAQSQEYEATIFQLAVQSGFFDVVSTMTQLSLEIDLTFMATLDLTRLPQKFIMQSPAYLELLLKQDSYKTQFKQSALKMYRICKYHLVKSFILCKTMETLQQLEICLFLAPLLQAANISVSGVHNDSIIDLILSKKINPNAKPLLYLALIHLQQYDKKEGFQLVESFCDKHPAIMHNKFYTQVIKNREAYEILQFLINDHTIDLNLTPDIVLLDNVVAEYLIMQGPIKYMRCVISMKQLIVAIRVAYDRTDNIQEFYTALPSIQYQMVAAIFLLILNSNKHIGFVHAQLSGQFELSTEVSQVAAVFKCIIDYHGGVEGTFLFLVNVIQSMLNNPLYLSLIQVKPIGDLNGSIIQERVFLDEVKEAFSDPKCPLQDNVMSLIIQASTKATHALHSDKWFHGFCLIKSLAHVYYSAQAVIHDIKQESTLDDYEKSNFWGLQDLDIEIKVELYPADQVAQSKVVVARNNKECWIKYPMGLVKDNQYMYPTILASKQGTEFARMQLIHQQFEQNRKSYLPTVEQFTFEGASVDNIQQLRMQTYKMAQLESKSFDGSINYQGKTLTTNYKRKTKFSIQMAMPPIIPQISSICVQVVSKEEFNKRERAQYLFGQILDDQPQKIWSMYIDRDFVNSIKEDWLIQDIITMVSERVPDRCIVNLASFIEFYFMRIANGMEKTYKKGITAKQCVDIGMQWEMLIKVMKLISNSLKFVSQICFEIQEIDIKKAFAIKLDGFDQLFRFGATELYIYNSIVVARLSIAQVSSNYQVLSTKPKLEQQDINVYYILIIGLPEFHLQRTDKCDDIMINIQQQHRIRKIIGSYYYYTNEQIGTGYSSIVYKGYHDATKQVVAIKVINHHKLNAPIYKSLLKSEIAVLRKLNSPYLLRVFEIYQTHNNTYIVSELCEQGDLADILENQKLSESKALEVLSHVVQGMLTLQEQNILHRDIKPANILISNGVYKLSDFGFAVIQNLEDSILERYNVGTPYYMAPESIQSNCYSEKTDIWSLGIVFYYMIYGHPPFQAQTDSELFQLYLQGPKLTGIEITKRTHDLIQGMLALDQNRRIGIQELWKILQQQVPKPSEHIRRPTHCTRVKSQRSVTPPIGRTKYESQMKQQSAKQIQITPITITPLSTKPLQTILSPRTSVQTINRQSVDTQCFGDKYKKCQNNSEIIAPTTDSLSTYEGSPTQQYTLPPKIRPTYQFCQLLDKVSLQLVDRCKIDTEYQKCYFLIKKFQAAKAYSILKYSPACIQDQLSKWIHTFKSYYIGITHEGPQFDRQFDVVFDSNLEEDGLGFQNILCYYIQQVQAQQFNKDLSAVQSVIEDNIKQNDPILFARKWLNQYK